MYWTDISERKIYKAFINGTGETELVTSELSIPGEENAYRITGTYSSCCVLLALFIIICMHTMLHVHSLCKYLSKFPPCKLSCLQTE